MTRQEAVLAWRDAQGKHNALKDRQKKELTAMHDGHSDELKASRAIVTKAKRAAEILALVELAAEAKAAE